MPITIWGISPNRFSALKGTLRVLDMTLISKRGVCIDRLAQTDGVACGRKGRDSTIADPYYGFDLSMRMAERISRELASGRGLDVDIADFWQESP